MNDADLASATERIMEKVDYYLHCELDSEYEHDSADTARLQLEIAIKRELLRANAIKLVTATSHVLSTGDLRG